MFWFRTSGVQRRCWQADLMKTQMAKWAFAANCQETVNANLRPSSRLCPACLPLPRVTGSLPWPLSILNDGVWPQSARLPGSVCHSFVNHLPLNLWSSWGGSLWHLQINIASKKCIPDLQVQVHHPSTSLAHDSSKGSWLALSNPETSIAIQKRQPYTGDVTSETPGDCERVLQDGFALVQSQIQNQGHEPADLRVLVQSRSWCSTKV